jgi:hypothetical protein
MFLKLGSYISSIAVSISTVCMAIVLTIFNGGIRKYDTWLSIGGVATILFP